MKKRVIAILLTTVMIGSCIPDISVSAATKNSNDYIKIVEILNILDTDKAIKNSNQTKITRAQFAQILCNLADAEDEITDSNLSVYPDVRSTYWGAKYIRYAVEHGYMTAYLSGRFMPNQTITLQEAVYSILKVLGYENTDFTGNLSTKVMYLYKQKKLNVDIQLTKNDPLTLEACTKLVYNALKTTDKQGKVYGEKFGCTLDNDGNINYLSLLNDQMGDAIIANNGWQYQIDGVSSSTQFYLNDVKTTSNKIRANDVIYYAKNIDIVFAYRNRVTGTVQAINSIALRPQSIQIQDKEYTISSSDVAEQFSIFGTIAVGDSITLLLGKDHTVEGVINNNADSYVYTGIVTDYQENTSTISTTDYIVRIVNADGIEESYSYTGNSDSFSKNDLVNVSVTGDTATIVSSTYTALKMSVNTEATKLGKYEFADNVAILDYKEGCYTKIYPSRLANLTLASSDILYVSFNEENEVKELILNNVTGDLYSYGMITGVNITKSGVAFVYDIGGKTNSTTETINGGVNIPIGLMVKGDSVVDSTNVYRIYVKNISDNYLTSTNQTKYLLSENCVAYEYDSDKETYKYVAVSDIKDESKYTLTAYYDKNQSEGGRVRLIIAEKK